MEKIIEKNPELIAACGLYCGACGVYRKGRCPGCKEKANASWCKVRSCCIDNEIPNCASCKQYISVSQCKHFQSPIARLFAFVFRSDRVANIETLKLKGTDAFADYMATNRLISIKK
ncbi:MAG: DUF3795 domain-containing protein [Bacteroidota bacterium]